MALPSTPQADIAGELAARIARAVRPWRIVLFGSQARGTAKPHSDYDLYVEIADPARTEKETAREVDRQIRELLSGEPVMLDLKINPPGTIERRRDDPGTIEWDVAREGRLLFADPDAPRTLLPPARVRESESEPPQSVHEWLETAERDLRHCEHLRRTDEDFSPEICWLSHQTCEKHLKALIVSCWVRPKRTHDLTELLAASRAAGCALDGLDDDCTLLTKHAIKPRYPAGLDLGPDDARVAYAAARRVVDAVRSALPPSVH
jgi:HEPN domain-containing protein/predicted nucleotidyltransferase